MDLKAPFPWFGGKSRAAPLIWQAIGNVPNWVEPFAGSLAALLLRPHAPQLETVNDRDAYIACVWRALAADPEAVASWCDHPVNEADQHAIHTWLVGQRETFTARLMGDPDYYDAKVAGRWIRGLCMWIGSDWCSGVGPWQSVDGELRHIGEATDHGIQRKLVSLGNAGRGVHRQLVHLGDAGQGVHRQHESLYAWFAALQARLRYVRVCCGDWTRVLGPSVTEKHGLTGILLDPPYSAEEGRAPHLYAVDDLAVAHQVRDWCKANGDNPLLRIVLCGYGEVHDALLEHGWTKSAWTANGGMANQRKARDAVNKYREVLYCSPACLTTEQHAQLRLL